MSQQTVRRRFSPDFKASLALEALRNDRSLTDLAREHKIHVNVIARWRDALITQAPGIFSSSDPVTADASNADSLSIDQRALSLQAVPNTSPAELQYLGQLLFGDTYELFDACKDVQFWVKDRACCYVHVNQAFLKNYSLSSAAEVRGKTDYDLSAPYLAERFQKDDRHLLQTGKALLNHLELVGHYSGTVHWFNTSKIALKNKRGTIIGTAGITYGLSDEQVTQSLYGEFGAVISHIRQHISLPIASHELAELVSLSVSAFERKFKRFFKHSPHQYIKRVRIRMASELLMTTKQAITDIAYECGFSDHSHLSREFKALMGLSPRAYRKQYAQDPSAPSVLA